MRRFASAMLVLALTFAAAGCGRSGTPGGNGGGPLTFTLIEPPAGAGTVTLDAGGGELTCPPVCANIGFDAGNITLTANDLAGAFSSWSGDATLCGADNPCVYQAFTDQSATAAFVAHVTVLTAGSSAGSVVSTPAGIDCPAAGCTNDFPFGSTVTLAATQTDSLLQGWTGDCAGDPDLSCDITADHHANTTALFGLTRTTLYGAINDEWAEAIAADPLVPGGYVLAGTLESPLAMGGATIPQSGNNGRNSFVARFDGAEAVTWYETIAGTGDIRPHSLALADFGGGELAVYIGGSFTGSVDFGGGATDPVGDVNGFVAMHLDGVDTADIVPQWSRAFVNNPAANDEDSLVSDIAVDGNELVAVGTYSGAANFGIALDTTNQNRKHFYAARYDADDGSSANAVPLGRGGASHAEASAVSFDANGDVLIVGFFNAQIDQGLCQTATNPGITTPDAWAFELTSALDNCGFNAPFAFHPTSDNRWSGLARGPLDLSGAVGYTRTGGFAITVGEYDVDGNAFPLGDYPTTLEPGPWGIAYDPALFEYVVAGSFQGTLDVAGIPLVSAGGYDIAVIRVDEALGTIISAIRIGGTGSDVVGGPAIPAGSGGNFFDCQRAGCNATGGFTGHTARAVAILPNSTAVITGWTNSTAIVDGLAHTNGGGIDVFVLEVARGPIL